MRWKTLMAAAIVAAFAVAPMSALAQDTGNTDQIQIITTMPETERGYAMTIYSKIPSGEQPRFIEWLNGFTPEDRLLVVRSLHGYSVASPDVANFTVDTTPDMAMPVFVRVVGSEYETPFTTFWGTLTPVQQTNFVTYARYVGPMTPAAAPAEPMQTPPMQPETTITAGGAAQPMATIAINMATAFAPFLPEADRTTFTTMASFTPPAELGGMAHFLSTLSAEQAGMVVRGLSKLDEMGRNGTRVAGGRGLGDYDAKKLFSGQLDSGDMGSFESMYNGMNDQQKTTLLQLTRDAYNGGLNDLGASMTSTSG